MLFNALHSPEIQNDCVQDTSAIIQTKTYHLEKLHIPLEYSEINLSTSWWKRMKNEILWKVFVISSHHISVARLCASVHHYAQGSPRNLLLSTIFVCMFKSFVLVMFKITDRNLGTRHKLTHDTIVRVHLTPEKFRSFGDLDIKFRVCLLINAHFHVVEGKASC